MHFLNNNYVNNFNTIYVEPTSYVDIPKFSTNYKAWFHFDTLPAKFISYN